VIVDEGGGLADSSRQTTLASSSAFHTSQQVIAISNLTGCCTLATNSPGHIQESRRESHKPTPDLIIKKID